MLLIAIVFGALVGAAASGEAGALAGALFGWLILRSLRQQREIEALRKRAERRCSPRRRAVVAQRGDPRRPIGGRRRRVGSAPIDGQARQSSTRDTGPRPPSIRRSAVAERSGAAGRARCDRR